MRTVCINPNRINQARLGAGMTQADVAFRLRQRGHKANERSIRRWESGQHAPHANMVPDLAAVLGVTIEKLYERSESGDEDDEDEVALRRLAHMAIDRGQDDLAVELVERARLIAKRRSEEVAR
jgi:transcriptional regulator with XRE-family HTH domain